MTSAQPPPRFMGKPYLQCLTTLEDAFPALKSFLEKLAKGDEDGRKAVKEYYEKTSQKTPGRCYALEFHGQSVTKVEGGEFKSATALREYLTRKPANKSREKRHKRLFILEDMEPDYVDALGHHLGVDPLVFSEQMNTWNFTDSWSIPHRGLPSMSIPGQSFTMRYYELRTLRKPDSVDVLSSQMSFAVNRRRYERWRDIDIPSLGTPDRRHAFVRRCASFWTSQNTPPDGNTDDIGWDAVILVDPAFATAREMLPDESANSATKVGTAKRKRDKPENDKVEPSELRTLDKCLILQDPETFSDRAELWESQGLDPTRPLQLKKVAHESWPYHKGCSTLAPLMFSEVGLGTEEMNLPIFQEKRNLTSALGEMVFYWTKVAKPDLIQQTNQKSSNAAYFLLKHVAQHWVNQLELMNTTIARGEWFSDDYQAQIDNTLSRKKWKDDLKKINEIAKDINYMRRHLNHFWRAMYLNLERLGVQLGNESVNEKASWAIQDAQKDFITIHTRMQPLRDRAEALNSVSNDLANLRAAFRGVSDGDFSLRLSLFASIVFPLTLLAGIFSMGDDYRPGKKNFWQLWGYGIPVCVVVALALVYGTRPWMVFIDMWKRIRPCLERVKLMKTKEDKAKQKRESECTQKQTPEENGSSGLAKLMRRKGWDNRDEESSVGK